MLKNICSRMLLVAFVTAAFFSGKTACSQPQLQKKVIAYYQGDGSDIYSFKTGQLTHIIYSFLQLKGNELVVANKNDSLAISRLVEFKKSNSNLKVLVSLGGWGGCSTCSQSFSTEKGRLEFAESALKLFKRYGVDGIDLDWEYPGIKSVSECKFMPEDKQHFTALIQILRTTLGPAYEISFAAGGFREYLVKSVDWKKVMPLVNSVNLMTYDFVNGNSNHTGHLTSLYSTTDQSESTDFNVKYLDSIGIPMNKIVIGLAFYARVYSGVEPANNGLYQAGKFSGYLNYREFEEKLGAKTGYIQYWDNLAKAPYAYNASTKTFATYDNLRSVFYKTKYAKDHNLGGVMFWELHGDKLSDGLLDMIYEANSE